MDRRQRKSRKAIYDAFLILLEKKSYSRITVQEIIDKADVGRTTFYAHFPTKDDLLSSLSEEMFSHVFATAFTREDNSIEKLIAHIFFHVRDTKIEIVLKKDSSELFISYFRQSLQILLSKYIDGNDPRLPSGYLIAALSSGIISTIEWWLSNEPGISADDMASYFIKSYSILYSAIRSR